MTFTFTIRSNPQPSSYVWSRDDEQVMGGNGLSLAVDSITVDPAMREHSGNYMLTVNN